MKEKKLPAWLKNRYLYSFFQSKAGRILSNWVLQGMLYMHPVEVVYKLVLDVILTALLVITVFDGPNAAAIVISFLVAHTINWIANCQPIALIRHLDWGRNDPRRFIDYIEGLHERINRQGFLLASASYGSLSGGNYKPTSDIDIRVIMRSGIANKIAAAHFCFIERVRAALRRFPLDLYAFTLNETMAKMNPKEPPVIFYDPENVLRRKYPNVVEFETFRGRFRERLDAGGYD